MRKSASGFYYLEWHHKWPIFGQNGLLWYGSASCNPKDKLWRTIWKWPDIKLFLWQAGHGKILTNGERVRRGLAGNPCCNSCQWVEESLSHVVRDCTLAKNIWTQLVGHGNWTTFRNGGVKEWLYSNLCCQNSSFGQENWGLTFGVALWFMWQWRNNFIFNNVAYPSNGKSIILHYAPDITSARNSSIPGNVCTSKVEMLIGWERSMSGYVKLNTDGCSKNSMTMASTGGPLRDVDGKWILGFLTNVG